jgi:hypothetical protein
MTYNNSQFLPKYYYSFCPSAVVLSLGFKQSPVFFSCFMTVIHSKLEKDGERSELKVELEME